MESEVIRKPELTFMTVRRTGGGSSRYGACEICKQDFPAIYAAELQRVYVRENGQHYLSPVGATTYGDMPCLLERFGTLRRDEDFQRVNSIKMVTPEQVEQLDRINSDKLMHADKLADGYSQRAQATAMRLQIQAGVI